MRHIAKAADKNADLHKEYLKFAQCVALECCHLFARIDARYAAEYLLEPIFDDFLRILDSRNLVYRLRNNKLMTQLSFRHDIGV